MPIPSWEEGADRITSCVCVCVVLLYSVRLQARGVKDLSSTQLNYKKNLSCGTPVMGSVRV